MTLTAKPRNLFYCDACRSVQSFDTPCRHIARPWPALTWLVWGLCGAITLAAWGGVYLLGHALGGW